MRRRRRCFVALTFAFWSTGPLRGRTTAPHMALMAFAAVLNRALWRLNSAI